MALNYGLFNASNAREETLVHARCLGRRSLKTIVHIIESKSTFIYFFSFSSSFYRLCSVSVILQRGRSLYCFIQVSLVSGELTAVARRTFKTNYIPRRFNLVTETFEKERSRERVCTLGEK